MKTKPQFYDPAQLVREVRELLHLHQLDTEIPGDTRLAFTGASMLLRALGITPAMDGAEALARAMDKPWVDTDDLVAEYLRAGERDHPRTDEAVTCRACGHDAESHAGKSGFPCDAVPGDSDVVCGCPGFSR